MPTVAELDVQINAKDDATATIAALDALVKSLDKDDVEIEIDADVNSAMDEISALEAEINSLSDETVTIEVDVDGEAEIERLRAELALLRDKHVDVEVDVDDDSVQRGVINLGKLDNQALNASRQISFLAASVLGLGTALIPIGAVGVAGVAALASQFTVAGIGAGLFGAVAVSAFKPVADSLEDLHKLQTQFNAATTDKERDAALEKMKILMDSLTPSQRAMVTEVERFRGAWGRLVKEFEPLVFQIATEGLRGIANILPSLAPVIDGAGKAFLFLERAAVRALAGPFWQSFISMLGSNVNPLMREFGLTIGNLLTGFAAMIMAFMPLTRDFSGGMLEMSKRFADWAKGLRENQGFQDFVAYVRENTPIVLGLIGSFVDALIALARAGAPLGEALLVGATNLFNFLSALQQAHPMLLTITLAVIGFTAVALNLIGPIVTIIRFIALLSTGLGYLGYALTLVSTAIGISAAALFAIVAVIAAVVAAFIYAYTHFESFRNLVNTVASAVADFAVKAYDAIVNWLGQAAAWLSTNFGPAIQAVMDFVSQQFDKIVQWVQTNGPLFAAAWETIKAAFSAIWNGIVTEITTGLAVIIAAWNFAWPAISGVLQVTWDLIKVIISSTITYILGIIQVFLALLAGDWGAAWDGIVMMLSATWEMMKGIVQAALTVLHAIIDTALAAIAAVFMAGWNLMIAGLQSAGTTMIAIVTAAWEAIKAAFSAAQAAIQAAVNAFWAAVFAIFSAAWAGIIAGLSSFWTTLRSLSTAAMSAILSVVSAGWASIRSAISSAMASITSVVSAGWAAIRSAISSAMASINSTVSAGWAAIRSAISSAMSAINSVVSSGMSAVVSAVQAGISAAVSAVTGMAGNFYSAGLSLMASLARGVADGVGSAVGVVRDAIGRVTDLLPGSPAKTGPLSGQGYALIRGQHLAEDLASGISGRSYLVDRAARDVADLMSLNTDPQGAFNAMATGPTGGGGGGGITINVADGAVVVQVGDGVDPKDAREAFDGAAGDLADELLTAIRRRQG